MLGFKQVEQSVVSVLFARTLKKMPNSSQVRMIKLSVSHIKRMTILANIEGLFRTNVANGEHNCYARIHSSLVDYLAHVKYAKNCPTTFYCIFQL